MSVTEEKQTLWTRDFTIITLGSVVSMFGNALSGFAMSLLVLDYTESVFLYAVYIAVFTLPQIFMPVFSGAILDRFSRKKTIYTLDFLSALLYLAAGLILMKGWFSFPVFALYVFLIGSINSIYMVAYQSFYPLLITKGNYQKAYSLTSMLDTASAVMVPLSVWIYNTIGISPLLFVNAASFFIAAVMETQIRAKEDYIELQKQTESQHRGRQFLDDIREGMKYLFAQKGLLAIACYYTVNAFAAHADNVIVLPYFRSAFENGEYLYMLVFGMSVAGRAIGGAFHYRHPIAAEKRYRLAMTIYIITSVVGAVYLYTPLPMMAGLMFLMGLMGVTTYTIRTSATQAYVPDERKGRFNGAFNMMNTVGSLSGQLLAGALATLIPVRLVVVVFYVINGIAAVTFIGGGKKDVSVLLNTQQ